MCIKKSPFRGRGLKSIFSLVSSLCDRLHAFTATALYLEWLAFATECPVEEGHQEGDRLH